MQPEDTEYLMKSITSEANQQKLQQDGTVDFGFAFGDKARFRVSAFRARGNIALVLRTISNNLLTLEQIGLPMACKDILFRPRGLVLVTGPTGSGKSTTLASMIDVINHERSDHIITIEDPIEFYHTSRKCIVTQREVHNDVPSFADVPWAGRGLKPATWSSEPSIPLAPRRRSTVSSTRSRQTSRLRSAHSSRRRLSASSRSCC